MVWPFSKGSTEEAAVSPTPKRSSERKRSGDVDAFVPAPTQAQTTTTTTTSTSTSTQGKQQLLLEDTEPRFNNGPAKPELPIKEAVSRISLADFKFDNLVKIPCFRDAALTGLSALGVLGAAVFVAQKSPQKAANWGVGGFLLGSTVAWEQCRSQRRKELAFAQQAKETVAKKERPMMKDPKEKLAPEVEKAREEVKSWWRR